MTRAVKLRVVLASVVGVVLVASAAYAAGSDSSAGKPKLTIVSETPLVLAGQGFRAGERVTLTASVTTMSVRRSLAAGSRGRFIARFRTGPVCGPIYARAVGSQGSRAFVRRQVIPGPCGPAPGVDLNG